MTVCIIPHRFWKLLYSSARRCFTLSGSVWGAKKPEATSQIVIWENSWSNTGSWRMSLSASHSHEFRVKRLRQHRGKDTDWVKNDTCTAQTSAACVAFSVLSLTRLHLPWRGKQCPRSRCVQQFFQGPSLTHWDFWGLDQPQSCTEDSNCERGWSAARWSKRLRETSFCSGEPRRQRILRGFSLFPLFDCAY